MTNYRDYVVRATAADAQVRAFAATTRDLTEYARSVHNMSPIATAALGRTMTGALMMADMLKNPGDLLTIQIDGDGPLGRITVTADSHGNVKGMVANPYVVIDEPNAEGHLNVGAAVGKGTLTVIRDFGLKEPYIGRISLHSGEIADDLTYYYAESEQIPSSIGLGVHFDRESATVSEAGGFIIQLMPHAKEETIAKIEQNLKSVPTVTQMLASHRTPEQMLELVLDGFDIQYTQKEDVRFRCNCSKERYADKLILLGTDELRSMIGEDHDFVLTCQFCGKQYTFTPADLRRILPRAVTRSRDSVQPDQKTEDEKTEDGGQN